MARDIFMGCAGVIVGFGVFCVVGAWSDPKHELGGFWSLVAVVFMTTGASGFIWFGETFF